MSNYGLQIPRERATAMVDRILGISPPGGRLEAAGSLRRGRATVGDVDLVIDGTEFFWVEKLLREIAHLAGEENCHRTKAGVLKRVTLDGVPVELYVSKPGAWGAQMLFCTGSPNFNIQQRAVATRKGLMLNQYGLYRESVDDKGKKVPGDLIVSSTEEEIFEALGMPFLVPAERERG